jgi:hypothetical protein
VVDVMGGQKPQALSVDCQHPPGDVARVEYVQAVGYSLNVARTLGDGEACTVYGEESVWHRTSS